MNRGGLPEMLHCLNSAAASENTEMSVLERQRWRLKLQQQEQQQLIQQNHQHPFPYLPDNHHHLAADQGLYDLLLTGAIKPDPGFQNGFDGDLTRIFNYGNESELEKIHAIHRTASCPPTTAAAAAKIAAQEAALSSAAGRESSKKRKADKTLNLKAIAEEELEAKKMKECEEEEQNSNSKSSISSATNTKKSKGPAKDNSDAPKTDYIHVRARRGQATDSHSLAERVRREKISERMKYLQDLVPGCNKITGKAGMLDEIINYVQSLQRQVEFLSMKLAVVNPRLDFDTDNYLTKQNFGPCSSSIPTMGTSLEMVNQSQLEFNSLVQGVEMVVNNPMDVMLKRTISAPVSIPHTFLDSSCLNQIQHLTWEDEMQNLYSME